MGSVKLQSFEFFDVSEGNPVPFVRLEAVLGCGAVLPYIVTTTGEYYDFNLYSGLGFPGEVGAGLTGLDIEQRQRLLGDDQSAGYERMLMRVRETLGEEIQKAEDKIAHLWFDSRTPADEV